MVFTHCLVSNECQVKSESIEFISVYIGFYFNPATSKYGFASGRREYFSHLSAHKYGLNDIWTSKQDYQ